MCKWSSNLLSDFSKLQNENPNEPFLSACGIKEKSKTKPEVNVSEVLGPILLVWVLLHVDKVSPFPVKRSITTYRRLSFLVTDNSEQ